MSPNKDLLTAISDANNDEPGPELSQKSPTENTKRRKKAAPSNTVIQMIDRPEKPRPKRQFLLVNYWFFEAHNIYHQARAEYTLAN